MVASAPIFFLAALAGAPASSGDALQKALGFFKSQDFAAAAATLAPGKGGQRCGPPLESYCAYYRGEALFYAGRFEEAAGEFRAARKLEESAATVGPLVNRALSREGEAHWRAGAAAEAVECLREAVKTEPTPERRLSLAEALVAEARTGFPAEAVAEWRRLYVEHPEHPTSELARQRLEDAKALTTLKVTDHLSRGERLLAVGLPGRALPAIHRAMGQARTPGEEYRAELALGRIMSGLREGERAEAHYRAVAVPEAPKGLQIDALLALGRAAMARGAAKEAAERLDDLVRRFPTDPGADEAAFLSAWTRFNTGDYAGCAERFTPFVAERGKSKRGDEGLWYLGLCRRLAGDAKGSDEALVELEKAGTRWAAQALYWRARNAKGPKAQEGLYRQAARRAPASWYALLARRRLAELGVADEPWGAQAAEAAAASFVGEREERAALLARIGLAWDAAAEMTVAVKAVKSPADAERLAAACASMGLWGKAYQVANARLWGLAFDQKKPAALGMLYPRAHAEAVRSAAAVVGLDPHFAWAIMRRESAFDPLALSTARAFGLMQLLAPTATKIAHLAGEPEPDFEALQRPERILPLATWYLAELTGRFGHAALAAAAYNGGPNAVTRWLGDRGGRPLDEFVETIPYKETRLYVKNVLADYFAYRALWGATEKALPFLDELPEAKAGAAF